MRSLSIFSCDESDFGEKNDIESICLQPLSRIDNGRLSDYFGNRDVSDSDWRGICQSVDYQKVHECLAQKAPAQ